MMCPLLGYVQNLQTLDKFLYRAAPFSKFLYEFVRNGQVYVCQMLLPLV
jgi:hypothetical protein